MVYVNIYIYNIRAVNSSSWDYFYVHTFILSFDGDIIGIQFWIRADLTGFFKWVYENFTDMIPLFMGLASLNNILSRALFLHSAVHKIKIKVSISMI